MSAEIRLALVGIGNCASALLQGLSYYRQNQNNVGLMHRNLGGYDVGDILPVVAFDVNRRKVGCDLAEAIFVAPNNAYRVPDVEVRATGVRVLPGPTEDGVPPHLAKFMEVTDEEPVDIVVALKDAGAEVVLNMLPTGSAKAARLYAAAAIEAGAAFINGMPELIVSDRQFAQLASQRRVPLVGDDVKS